MSCLDIRSSISWLLNNLKSKEFKPMCVCVCLWGGGGGGEGGARALDMDVCPY